MVSNAYSMPIVTLIPKETDITMYITYITMYMSGWWRYNIIYYDIYNVTYIIKYVCFIMFGEDSWNINVVILWRVTSPRFGLDAIGVDISPKRIKQVEMDGDFTLEDRMIKNMDMYGHSPTAVISSTFDGVRNKPGSSSGQVSDIGFGHQAQRLNAKDLRPKAGTCGTCGEMAVVFWGFSTAIHVFFLKMMFVSNLDPRVMYSLFFWI